MFAEVKIVESKSNRTKCSCCGEVIPTCMKYSKVEGDKYCHYGNCHTYYMHENHNIQPEEDRLFEREQLAEREREIHATYHALGYSNTKYLEDKDFR